MPERGGTLTLAKVRPVDARESATVHRELPGLAEALDETAMVARLEHSLRLRPGHRLARVQLEHAAYTPGAGVVVRYRAAVAGADGAPELLLNARLFSSPDQAARFFQEALAPLARRAGRRPELEPLSSPLAFVDALAMTLSAYPVDGRLPALVEATNPAHMSRRLASRAGGSRGGACRVSLVRYRSGRRCILRYELAADAQSRVVYGKLAADDRGRTADLAIRRLRAAGPAVPTGFGLPRSLGYVPSLGLLLLEAVPGSPEVSRALKRFAHGEPVPLPVLEAGLERCAEVAAALHRCAVAGLPARPADRELARLRREVAAIRRAARELSAELLRALEQAARALAASPATAPCTCHGDFKHNQILFDGDRRTLVDLDTVCTAEPALDVGHFLAYLRLKLTGEDAPAPPRAVEHLCRCFVSAYLEAAGPAPGPAADIVSRANAYAILCMVQRAVHSWQKFKRDRLVQVMAYLEAAEL